MRNVPADGATPLRVSVGPSIRITASTARRRWQAAPATFLPVHRPRPRLRQVTNRRRTITRVGLANRRLLGATTRVGPGNRRHLLGVTTRVGPVDRRLPGGDHPGGPGQPPPPAGGDHPGGPGGLPHRHIPARHAAPVRPGRPAPAMRRRTRRWPHPSLRCGRPARPSMRLPARRPCRPPSPASAPRSAPAPSCRDIEVT